MPSAMTASPSPGDSFLAPWRAAKFILKNRGIWHFIAVPIFINVTTFIVLGSLAVWWFFGSAREWFGFSEAWYATALMVSVQVLAAVAVLIAVIALITLAANIFAAPFNEILSHRTEEIIKNKKIKERGHVIKGIIQETIIFFVFIIIQLFLLLLNFIPGIGALLYIIVNFVLLSYFYCFQFLDYPMDRHNVPFFRRWKMMFRSPLASLLFGAAALLGMVVPLLNLFYIPICVVAGTMLYSKYEPPLPR